MTRSGQGEVGLHRLSYDSEEAVCEGRQATVTLGKFKSPALTQPVAFPHWSVWHIQLEIWNHRILLLGSVLSCGGTGTCLLSRVSEISTKHTKCWQSWTYVLFITKLQRYQSQNVCVITEPEDCFLQMYSLFILQYVMVVGMHHREHGFTVYSHTSSCVKL